MSISRMSRIGGEVTVVGGLPSFVFLTLPYYLRARLQWLRHSPSCRVLGAFLNAVESRHPLCRDSVDWRGEDDQYQDIATSHLFFLCLPLPAGRFQWPVTAQHQVIGTCTRAYPWLALILVNAASRRLGKDAPR